MINKNLIFTISFTLFALKTFCFQKISSDSTKLTIVIQNSTQNPILIGSGRSYLKLKDYEVISHKKKDTLQLSITGTEFIWYSHKGVEKDTLLISAGDTLILNSNATAIKSIVKYKDATFINRLSLFQEFIKSSEYVSLKYRIDSLKNLFYGTSDTKPTEFFGDFDKMSMSPLKVNYNFYERNKPTFILLTNLLEEQYVKDNNFIYNNQDVLGQGLYNALSYQLRNKFTIQHKLLYRMFRDSNVLETVYNKGIMNDNLIKNPYSMSILGTYLEDVILKGISNFSKSREYLDYKEAYDGIPDSLDNNLKKYCRFICIEKMVEFGESIKDLSRYYSDFKTRYKDASLNSYLDKKFQLNLQSELNDQNDVKLISSAGQITSLNKIIKSSTGKLIYVDFWASWCAPCRDAMPASRKLAEAFKTKKIIFIYLSTDKNNDEWLKAAHLEKINNVSHSYRILNNGTSKFLKEIKLSSIPRYLLFDKTGKLLYADAQGPESPDLIEIINSNLN